MKYEVADAFEYALNCHWSQCRRTTGSAFKPLAGIEPSKLLVRRGEHEALLRRLRLALYSLVREGRYVHVALGTLVDEPSIRPSMHICVGSKAGWFEITDQLSHFDGLPMAEDALPLLTFVDSASLEQS